MGDYSCPPGMDQNGLPVPGRWPTAEDYSRSRRFTYFRQLTTFPRREVPCHEQLMRQEASFERRRCAQQQTPAVAPWEVEPRIARNRINPPPGLPYPRYSQIPRPGPSEASNTTRTQPAPGLSCFPLRTRQQNRPGYHNAPTVPREVPRAESNLLTLESEHEEFVSILRAGPSSSRHQTVRRQASMPVSREAPNATTSPLAEGSNAQAGRSESCPPKFLSVRSDWRQHQLLMEEDDRRRDFDNFNEKAKLIDPYRFDLLKVSWYGPYDWVTSYLLHEDWTQEQRVKVKRLFCRICLRSRFGHANYSIDEINLRLKRIGIKNLRFEGEFGGDYRICQRYEC